MALGEIFLTLAIDIFAGFLVLSVSGSLLAAILAICLTDMAVIMVSNKL